MFFFFATTDNNELSDKIKAVGEVSIVHASTVAANVLACHLKWPLNRILFGSSDSKIYKIYISVAAVETQ